MTNITAYDRGIAAKKINQIVIKGNGGSKITYTPTPGTIGADPQAMEAINGWIKRLAQARIKRLVKERKYKDEEAAKGPVYKVIGDQFKKDFGIPKKDRRRIDNIIKTWLISRKDEVIEYFQSKYNRTIDGIIKGASKKEGHIPPFWRLMQHENSLLKILGLKYNSPEVTEALSKCYGVTSHKELYPNDHMNWIAYLENLVDKIMDGSLNPHDVKL